MGDIAGQPIKPEKLSRELFSASRRLAIKALLSALILPLVVLVLFSLSIFRFGSRQYTAFLLAVAVVIVPLTVIYALVYTFMQRSLARRLTSWYDRPRDASRPEDRALAVRLQRDLYGSGFRHGAIVGVGIFLALALSVLVFGPYAEFTPYLTISYISLGFLLSLVEFFITVFLSHREMRPVMALLLSDCRGFGFHPASGIGKRLLSFSLVIMVLTLGVAWIASSYLSSEMLKEEVEKKAGENVLLLAQHLSSSRLAGASSRDLEEAFRKADLSSSGRTALLDAEGRVFSQLDRGGVAESVWENMVKELEDPQEDPLVRFVTASNRQYLVASSSLPGIPGWKVVRVGEADPSFQALRRLTPTMLLLLLVSAGVAVFLTLVLTHNLADPLKRLVGCCRLVAQGDLQVEVPVESLDDVGELSSSYAEMLESLRRITLGLLETSGEVSEGAESIVAVSEEIMGAIEELNALVEDLSGQIEEEVEQIRNVEEIMLGVAETISRSHSQASRSLEISRDAERLVLEGRERAREAVEKIGEFKDLLDTATEAVVSLGESSKKIDTIVDIITRIAEQTNLLALNAAIEAARVPEHGKGFAVVADEVKKLAQEAAASAHRISDLVRTIQQDVETARGIMEKGTMGIYIGMETVDRTDQSLVSIAAVMGQIAGLVESIAQASAQELSQSERLSASLEAMHNQVETTAQAYQEIESSSEQQTQVTSELTTTAEKLADIARRLQEMVSRFRVERDDGHEG